MTFPISHNSYTVSSGSSPSTSPIFIARDPTSSDVAYPVQQRWINTQTQGIWVLESFSSLGGVVTATWRALAPIVLSTSDPTSSDYLYPIGQTWVNTSSTDYFVLVNVTGTTANWDLISTGSGTFVTVTPDSGGAVSPTAGNLNAFGSGSITTVGNPGTSTVTTQLTGLTNHAVLVGAGTTTITKVGPTATTGQVLQNNAAADPSYSTATYPSTTTINQILYSSANNTVTGLTTAIDGVVITSHTGVPSVLANGTAGQVLTANTGSPPSWQGAGAGDIASVVIQTLTVTGNYTPSANLLYAVVEILGGGAAGGGSRATGAGEYSVGGGGGAGEYARGVYSLAQIQAAAGWTGTALPFAIGAGGTGVAAGTGNTGGTTTFGTAPLLSAIGGTGGTSGLVQMTGFYSQGLSGTGGTGGTGGSFRSRGSNGATAIMFSTAGAASDGTGGSTLYGSGGSVYSATAAAGYGAGGFGNVSANGTGALAGSTGAPGVIIITEYIA